MKPVLGESIKRLDKTIITGATKSKNKKIGKILSEDSKREL